RGGSELGPLMAVEELQLLARLVRDVERDREAGRGIRVEVLLGRRLHEVAARAEAAVEREVVLGAGRAPELRAGARRAQRRDEKAGAEKAHAAPSRRAAACGRRWRSTPTRARPRAG